MNSVVYDERPRVRAGRRRREIYQVHLLTIDLTLYVVGLRLKNLTLKIRNYCLEN